MLLKHPFRKSTAGHGERTPCFCCFTSASRELWTLQSREWLLGRVVMVPDLN